MKLWFWPYTQGSSYAGARRKKKRKMGAFFKTLMCYFLRNICFDWTHLTKASIYIVNKHL